MKVHRNTAELEEIIEGYKTLIQEQKKEIWELKQIASKNKNLLQGYKKVIQDLSSKLSQKDS